MIDLMDLQFHFVLGLYNVLVKQHEESEKQQQEAQAAAQAQAQSSYSAPSISMPNVQMPKFN